MELKGTTGTLLVTPPSNGGEPTLTVNDAPFSVDATTVEVIQEGSGEIVPDLADVKVDYHGVNGRSGEVFDSSFRRGAPVAFPLNGVVAGFAKAIAGQKVGSQVVVAMTPEDGYGTRGNPMAGILGTDTLTFFITIHEVQ